MVGDTDGGEALVEYRVSGGFIGRNDSVLVMSPESAVVERHGERSELELGAAEADDLVAALDSTGLFDRDRRLASAGADLQVFTIRYRGSTLTFDDTTVPPELVEVLDRLEALLRR